MRRQKSNENKNDVNKQTKGGDGKGISSYLNRDLFTFRKPDSHIAALHMHLHIKFIPNWDSHPPRVQIRVRSFENDNWGVFHKYASVHPTYFKSGLICAFCWMHLKFNLSGCNIYMAQSTVYCRSPPPPCVMQTSRLPRSVCSSQFQQLDDALRLS